MPINNFLIILITTLANILTIVIILNAILSFVLNPFHPIRMALGRVLEPIYGPIRRVIPPIGMMDFTPLVVLLAIQLIERFLISLLLR
jgi:YggT family protein